jgi:DNA topoisomerase-3
MGKSLIIAEKPSVAQDIARALGGFKKQQLNKSAGRDGEFLESDEYVLSSAVGHLLELAHPDELAGKVTGKWSFAKLPAIPGAFTLKPVAKSEPRLKLLKRLASRADVTAFINACDAGREGELIFRYIVQHAAVEKPIRRLWLQSMTPDAIRDGFAHLKDDHELRPLAAAAYCRSESDWLVGINGTRALTAFNSRNGGFQKTTVGRVQTPTLAIVVERDRKIKNFKPRDYWEVHATFGAAAGQYPGRWFDESFKKPEKENGEASDVRAERIWVENDAERIRAKCEGKPGIVTEEKKPTTQIAPQLFDLTTLQREANGRYGMSAKSTLQVAQALYERHKVLTYPRTDSRCLPEDYIPIVKATMSTLSGVAGLGPFASAVQSNGWVKPNKRIFNNAKVSDHFAIIPTQQAPHGLDQYEQKIYDLVARRFLAVFYPAARFEVTTRITRVEEEPFKSEGKVMIDPGWMAVYGKTATEEGGMTLVAVSDGEKVRTDEIEVRALQTRPPAAFTEATLLSAMEGAGKLVEDDELREAMAAKGLGTPATRATVIEGLIEEEYLRREARELHATPKAFALLDLLHAIDIVALTSPEMTGNWEYKLKQIERGEFSRESFMGEIQGVTRKIVEQARTFDEGTAEAKPIPVRGPHGEELVETLREYRSRDGAFAVRKVVGGRLIEPDELRVLVEKGFLGPLSGFRSRQGFAFSASLKLAGEGKIEFVFDNEPVNSNGERIDFTQQEPVGQCPVDGGRLYETLGAFACEHGFANPPACKFKINRKILEQEISREQAAKLLTSGKTDLLTRFISKRTRKPFSAFLVLTKEHKVEFEFPPREAKPKGKAKIAKGRATRPEKEDDEAKAA